MNNSENSKRLLLLTNIISPYRIPFLNSLSNTEGINLKVLYVAEQEEDRRWETYVHEIEYSMEVLRGLHIPMRERTIHFNHGIQQRIVSFCPDTVIIGTDILSTPASWVALLSAVRLRSKVIRFEGQHFYTASRSRIKRFLYSIFYMYCDAFFVYSILSKQYLESLGVDGEKVTVGYNVGDTDLFQKHVQNFANSSGFDEYRKQYPSVMFLFIGTLDQNKNILALLEAFRTLRFSDAGLFVLGDGQQRQQVIDFCSNNPNLNVFYEGFKQKGDIIRYFALSDIFVLPTFSDRASIVLSEALWSGLFTIGSKFDGSSCNFIRPGMNGQIVDPTKPNQLSDALTQAYYLKRRNAIIKSDIRKTMAEYTVQRYAQRLVDMVCARALPGGAKTDQFTYTRKGKISSF